VFLVQEQGKGRATPERRTASVCGWLPLNVGSCQSGSWKKSFSPDPTENESFTWATAAAWQMAGSTYENFWIQVPMGAASKARFFTLSAIMQWWATAGATAGVSIYVGGKLCGGGSDFAGGVGLRSSAACTFKVPAGFVPDIRIQFIGTGTAKWTVDDPSGIAVSFMSIS
jgi:hypothetical protein